MFRFLVFLGALFILSLIGLVIWAVWSKVYTYIKRNDSVFEIEEETHEKIKKKIREE